MPVFRAGPGQAPAWCEMRQFDIVRLPAGAARYDFGRAGPREKLIVGEGACTISAAGREQAAAAGANIDLPAGKEAAGFSILAVAEDTTLIRMAGEWGDEVGGSGLFSAEEVTDGDRVDRGDPVPYEKRTRFDCHFHDCDEYWIFFAGSGIAVSEGKSYEVASGDCVATGMGHHHDFPIVTEPVRAVYFETTMEGRKRRGHLWDHTHGKAEPRVERG